jgi:hypothetical protein
MDASNGKSGGGRFEVAAAWIDYQSRQHPPGVEDKDKDRPPFSVNLARGTDRTGRELRAILLVDDQIHVHNAS